MNAFRVAGIQLELTRALGYELFAARGGDPGRGVARGFALAFGGFGAAGFSSVSAGSGFSEFGRHWISRSQ